MARQFRGGAPSTIDGERLRNILDLSPGDRRLLAAHLSRSHPKLWPAEGLDEQRFYAAVRTLIGVSTGTEAWEAAARSVGGHQRGERLSLKLRIDRSLAYRISEALGGDAYLAVASDLPAQRRQLRERLKQAKQWGTLAELLWADLIHDRDAEGAFETIAATPDIQGLLEEVLAAAEGAEGDGTEAADVAEPVPPSSWSELVEEARAGIKGLDGKQPDVAGARALLSTALALVEIAEQAEEAIIAEREAAFAPIAEACEALAGEGVLAEALAEARSHLAHLAPHAGLWQAWTGRLEEALAEAKKAIEDKQRAQRAFREASSEDEDIPRIEAALAALKEARTRTAALVEQVNALLIEVDGGADEAAAEQQSKKAASA